MVDSRSKTAKKKLPDKRLYIQLSLYKPCFHHIFEDHSLEDLIIGFILEHFVNQTHGGGGNAVAGHIT